MRHLKLLAAPAIALALAFLSVPASADDWTAVKLRGVVLHLVDGTWTRMARGDVVPDGDVIRTLMGARVDMQRGAEVVTLGGNTQVQIFDKDGQQFTTVKQYFGTVEIEAEVQDVEHFAVQTRYLAAVVKGTHFVVRATDSGAEVAVKRGHVAVSSRETHEQVTVSAGQSVRSDSVGELLVSGAGDLPAVVDTLSARASGSENGLKLGLNGNVPGPPDNPGNGKGKNGDKGNDGEDDEEDDDKSD
jgi:ferric-dicitrate binding protein FerR (iron transport regulator)